MLSKRRRAKPHPLVLVIGALLVSGIYAVGYMHTRDAAARLTNAPTRTRPSPQDMAEAQRVLDMALSSPRGADVSARSGTLASSETSATSPSGTSSTGTAPLADESSGGRERAGVESQAREDAGASTSRTFTGTLAATGLPAGTASTSVVAIPDSSRGKASALAAGAGASGATGAAADATARGAGAVAAAKAIDHNSAPASSGIIATPATVAAPAGVAAAVTPATSAPSALSPNAGSGEAAAAANTTSTNAADSSTDKPPSAPDSPKYKDGQYVGYGYCRHGEIQATIVVKGGRIVDAFISGCYTRYTCDWIAKLPPQVVERQSPEVDFVSGATESADAFYYAIVDALKKAK